MSRKFIGLFSFSIITVFLFTQAGDYRIYSFEDQDTSLSWGGLRARVSAGGGGISANFATAMHCQGAMTILCGDEQSSAALSSSEIIDEADWHGIDAHLPFPRYASP